MPITPQQGEPTAFDGEVEANLSFLNVLSPPKDVYTWYFLHVTELEFMLTYISGCYARNVQKVKNKSD